LDQTQLLLDDQQIHRNVDRFPLISRMALSGGDPTRKTD
jgi:hypothetical protein